MKKISLFFLAFVSLLVGCSSENAVKETASNYLKKQMKNPDSFKIESIEVRKDTIPPYLCNEILTLADKFNDATDEYNRYKDRSYLWADEKFKSREQMLSATENLQQALKSAYSDEQAVEYLVYIKYSGTNSVGGTVSNKAIVIIDNKDPKKVLGLYTIDTDFIKQFVIIKMVGSDFKFDFKQNKYGKFETEDLPYFEQFILDEAE